MNCSSYNLGSIQYRNNHPSGDNVVVSIFFSDSFADFWFQEMKLRNVYLKDQYELSFVKNLNEKLSDKDNTDIKFIE